MRKTDGGRIGVESDDKGSIVSNRLFIKRPNRNTRTNRKRTRSTNFLFINALDFETRIFNLNTVTTQS